jgi:hypothetical protein
MSEVIQFGPLWSRTVFDGNRRVIRYPGKMPLASRKVPFDQVQQIRVREYITRVEEEQLVNANPEVQKDRRGAELWIDLKDGQSLCAGEHEQAGLLLTSVAEVANKAGIPVVAERTLLTDPSGRPTSGK